MFIECLHKRAGQVSKERSLGGGTIKWESEEQRAELERSIPLHFSPKILALVWFRT